jgi:hypothetical protein
MDMLLFHFSTEVTRLLQLGSGFNYYACLREVRRLSKCERAPARQLAAPGGSIPELSPKAPPFQC